MCTEKGPGPAASITDLRSGETLAVHAHSHARSHSHAHDHHHEHSHDHGTTVHLGAELLGRNNALAERTRGWFAGRGILAVNLMSAPGSGKTTLLERTIRELGGELSLSVIEGDQQTLNDAERIRAAGGRVVQINTGVGCHLDASMVARGLQQLAPPAGSVVLIENVGNLVCPAMFDLGERARVVIMSVTEGEDKPLKYPHMFRAGTLMILNKTDLLPYVTFDADRCVEYARQVNPGLQVVRTSATTGEGLAEWYDWLRAEAKAAAAASWPGG